MRNILVVIPTRVWRGLQKGYEKTVKTAKKYPRTVVALKVAVIFVIIFIACFQRLDPDFGWHLQSGNYIRVHGIPTHDVFTYSARQFPWIDHEWGNDVLVSFMYQWGGYLLLSGVFAGLWTASLCLFRDKIRLWISLIATMAFMSYLGVRAVAWSVLGTVILLGLIRQRSRRAMLFIPLLFLIWTNLHGGFVVGLAIIAYFALTRLQWRWWCLLLICTLTSFINPYGPRLYVEIARTLFDPALHHEVGEWRSFYLRPTTWPFIVLWGVGFWLFAKNKLTNWLGLAPIALLASLSASRNMPLFTVIALRDVDSYSKQFKLPKNLDWPRKLIMAFFIIVSLGVTGYYLYASYSPYGREATYPQQAVAYLRAHECKGNLFNDYNYGGYLIWKLPHAPVYIDGRMPSWRYPSGQTYIARYYDLLKDSKLQKAEFARYNIHCALINHSGLNAKIYKDLTGEGWRVKVNANGAVLLVDPQ